MPRKDHERWQMDLEEYIRQGDQRYYNIFGAVF